MKDRKLGDIIRHHRKEKKLSQQQLGELIGYKNGQFISNIEREVCSIPNKDIRKMAGILGMNPLVIVNFKIDNFKKDIYEKVIDDQIIKEIDPAKILLNKKVSRQEQPYSEYL